MHRAIPVPNKICEEKRRKREYELHRKKLSNIKSSIDNSPPKPMKHLKTKPKKVQLEQERFETIQRENMILLNKMMDIMNGSHRLDNNNTSMNYRQSLNYGKRKQELERITAENQAILKRIQERQPVYNHRKWEEDRVRNEKYLKNICEYDYVLGSSNKRGAAEGRRKSRSPRSGRRPDQTDEFQYSQREEHTHETQPGQEIDVYDGTIRETTTDATATESSM